MPQTQLYFFLHTIVGEV